MQHGPSHGPSVSLVTGGARGIGAALAAQVVARGGQVVVADVDEPAGLALVERLRGGAGSSGAT
jgi:NAD(P)-dependent dehydrogenase (short-subunit alcohol dehydrogenase family)